MKRIDLNNAVSINRDIHWVGFYDKDSYLHCNPYLLIDDNDIILFDPGSITHFPIVMRKVIELVKPEEITAIVVCHQDPDVCGSLSVVEDVINNRNLEIVAHTNSIRLIRHLGVRSDFYAVDEHDLKLTLRSGRVLDFLFAPYLHSPGAIVTYDRQTKSLFSGDIFGAVSKEWNLFTSDDFLSQIAAFHQIYMPSNRILKAFLERLEGYEIERILPQHGSVIEGENIQIAIDHLKTTPCGIDIDGNIP